MVLVLRVTLVSYCTEKLYCTELLYSCINITSLVGCKKKPDCLTFVHLLRWSLSVPPLIKSTCFHSLYVL